MKEEVEFIMKDGRFKRRYTSEEDLGGQEQVLAQLVEASPILLKQAGMVGTNRVHLIIAPTYVVAFTELTGGLPMRVHMDLSADGKKLVAPGKDSFTRNGHALQPGCITIKDPWTPPEGLKLYLFLQCSQESSGPLANTVYLLLRAPDGTLLSPWYPNCYENGKMCMGDDWNNVNNGDFPTVFDKFSRTFQSFHTTEMNNHLVDHAEHMQRYERSIGENGHQEWVKPDIGSVGIEYYGRVTSLSWGPVLAALDTTL